MFAKSLVQLGVGALMVLASTGSVRAESYTGSTTPASSLNWAEKMFSELKHDFGVVARGADTRCKIAIKNLYAPEVHIADVRTSCGCTAGKLDRTTLASHEVAYIDVTMNTVKFKNQKDSSITVVFDAPMHAEVRIPIRAYIRPDVVLSPGEVNFGKVSQGEAQTRKIAVAYAGRGNWHIKSIVNHHPHLTVKAVEKNRTWDRVDYEIEATVAADAPVGAIREQVTLITDDAGNPQVPVMIEGKVEAEFAITPEVVSLGDLAPGERKTVKVVVRGRRPFTIEKLESTGKTADFEADLTNTAAAIQVLLVTVTAPAQPGTVDEQLNLQITGVSSPIPFRAYGKVTAASSTQAR